RRIFHHAARALDALAQFHARHAAGNLHNASGNAVTFFVLGNVFVQAGRDHLLDAETHVAFGAVHIQHLGFYGLADLEHVLWVIDSFFRADFAHVDHSLHALGNLHKRAKLGDADYRPFNDR